jgi:RNA polymerase sigma-70 factor, ECF subfamily
MLADAAHLPPSPGPASPPPLAPLVRAARRGDARAWRALFDRLQPALTAYCRLCAQGRRDLALDWTQDVFTLAFQGLGQLRDDERFAGWLFAIARRHCARHARLSGREQQLSDAMALLLVGDALPEVLQEQAEREAWLEALRRACDDVENPTHRECVVAHYSRGEKTRDIAARLEVPHGTVTVTLMRFREGLKRRLAQSLAEGALP